jgi:hypothetical protein
VNYAVLSGFGKSYPFSGGSVSGVLIHLFLNDVPNRKQRASRGNFLLERQRVKLELL